MTDIDLFQQVEFSDQLSSGPRNKHPRHTDELYISHYNTDRGGDQGLFDKHYDGNLRFLSSSIVVGP